MEQKKGLLSQRCGGYWISHSVSFDISLLSNLLFFLPASNLCSFLSDLGAAARWNYPFCPYWWVDVAAITLVCMSKENLSSFPSANLCLSPGQIVQSLAQQSFWWAQKRSAKLSSFFRPCVKEEAVICKEALFPHLSPKPVNALDNDRNCAHWWLLSSQQLLWWRPKFKAGQNWLNETYAKRQSWSHSSFSPIHHPVAFL